MRRLTQNEGLRALGMLQVGTTQTVVARTMNVSQSVISRLWSRYRATHSVNDRRRSGRPMATTHAQDRFIRTLALRNHVKTANQIRARLQADTGVRVSAQTIRNRLHRGHFHTRRPRVIPCLRDHHIRARRRWCRDRQHWDNRRWNNVMFSDESRFTVDFLDRHRRMWRRRNERFHDVNVIRHDQFGGGSVMVWGGITAAGRTDLHVVAGRVTGQYYRDNILAAHVVPFARRHGRRFNFQDDNARCHRARIVTDYLQQRHITTLP